MEGLDGLKRLRASITKTIKLLAGKTAEALGEENVRDAKRKMVAIQEGLQRVVRIMALAPFVMIGLDLLPEQWHGQDAILLVSLAVIMMVLWFVTQGKIIAGIIVLEAIPSLAPTSNNSENTRLIVEFAKLIDGIVAEARNIIRWSRGLLGVNLAIWCALMWIPGWVDRVLTLRLVVLAATVMCFIGISRWAVRIGVALLALGILVLFLGGRSNAQENLKRTSIPSFGNLFASSILPPAEDTLCPGLGNRGRSVRITKEEIVEFAGGCSVLVIMPETTGTIGWDIGAANPAEDPIVYVKKLKERKLRKYHVKSPGDMGLDGEREFYLQSAMPGTVKLRFYQPEHPEEEAAAQRLEPRVAGSAPVTSPISCPDTSNHDWSGIPDGTDLNIAPNPDCFSSKVVLPTAWGKEYGVFHTGNEEWLEVKCDGSESVARLEKGDGQLVSRLIEACNGKPFFLRGKGGAIGFKPMPTSPR